MRELVIPPAAERDPESWELLRAWVAEKQLYCSLKIGVYEAEGFVEEEAWGIILADAAKHVADALSSRGIRDREATLSKIRLSFAAELDNPTSNTQGSFNS